MNVVRVIAETVELARRLAGLREESFVGRDRFAIDLDGILESADPDVPLCAEDVALLRSRLAARATPTPTGKSMMSFLFCEPSP